MCANTFPNAKKYMGTKFYEKIKRRIYIGMEFKQLIKNNI